MNTKIAQTKALRRDSDSWTPSIVDDSTAHKQNQAASIWRIISRVISGPDLTVESWRRLEYRDQTLPGSFERLTHQGIR